MKYVKILGGLGNQMFQYAFALSLAQKNRVSLDISGFKRYDLHNGLEIDKLFKLELPTVFKKNFYSFANNRYGRKVFRKRILLEKSDMSVSEVLARSDKAIYFDGYWQNEAYFKEVEDRVRETIVFDMKVINTRNSEILERIIQSDSVGIHVRRGDYVNHPLYEGICTEEYYKKCIHIIGTSNKAYFIFSNDIEYCKKKFDLLNVTYIDYNVGEESYWDMVLMSYCKTLIIANSSFSWWGAWLNPLKCKKQIYCPSKWLNDEKVLGAVTPKSWIKVEIV